MKARAHGGAAWWPALVAMVLWPALLGPSRAEGPSTAESQALLDLTVALCSRALPRQTADFEKTRRPPYTCMDVSAAQVQAVRRSAPYQEAFRRLSGELGSMPMPARLAWCREHLTARCIDEAPRASDAPTRDIPRDIPRDTQRDTQRD